MKSISVIRLLDVLSVRRISEARGIHPRSIIVDGEDFSSVEAVLINGSRAPEIASVSNTRLLAQVPEDQVQSVITDVAVLSAALTLTERSVVEFTLGTRVRTISGVQRMMQVFIRHLLRTPGTNIFHPRSGGGLRKRIGGIFNDSAVADATMAVAAARQYIISAQTADRTIPPSERLLSAEIMGLRPDLDSGTLYMTVVLTSHAGARSAASLVA